MALRVLLADESSTIKKVMQLALQDFGVEVKAVPIGIDVIQVSKAFQPDIIFADVLLSKRTGYEVAGDVKADPTLKRIPVVLMWSGFMEIDEARAVQSGAERRLEKPFDADHLRSLVKDLVPRLQENRISDYLAFPDLPEIVETPLPPSEEKTTGGAQQQRQPAAPAQAAPPPPPPPPRATKPAAQPLPPISNPTRSVPEEPAFPEFGAATNDLEDPDDFQQVPLPGAKTKNTFEQRREEEEWRQGGLEQFRVAPSIPEIDGSPELIDLTSASLASTDGVEDISLEQLENLVEKPKMPPPPPRNRTFTPAMTGEVTSSAQVSLSSLDPVRAEEVLREQVREVLESIAWKIIPDIAERVVREEVQRLLKEAERL